MNDNKKRVLVVDDEQLILKIISDILTKEGYEVVVANNCEKATEYLRTSRIDVVLSDIKMPVKSGIDLLEEIKKKDPNIPVILMTGFASLETAVEAVQNGAFDYLIKPLDYGKLRSVIEHAADRYELHKENTRLLSDLKELNTNLELKVQERNRQLENTLNSTIESIITTDRDLIVETANPKTSEIFGRTCAGEKLSSLFQGINFDTIVPKILSDPSYSTKHEVRHDSKFLEVTLSPLIDFETKEIFGVIAATEDITEKKKLEAQLIHSAKMSGVGQLAAGVAHEFNNILSGIIGYTSLALTRQDLESARKDLKVIEKASDRAVEIVNKLLSFSRQKGEKFQVAQIESIIDDALGLVEHTFETEGIRILRSYEKVPAIRMNLGEIQQVFLNLAINSKHAMPQGGAIAISTKLAGNFVRIDFSDTGAGIPPENLSRIFEPFFTTKQSEGSKSGTGLGLSVIYAIIERHGGRIEVSSELNKGTTFTIHLPNIQTVSKAAEAEPAEKFQSAKVIELRRKGNVLIIDDEEFIRDIVSECLSSTGHNVMTAESGEQAIELIKKNHFDITFLDFSIPNKNGLELLREIKMIDPNSTVVIISSRPGEQLPDELTDEGAYNIIKKPFSVDQIQIAVSRVLGAEAMSR
ncbi:MAG TPA: response regulator [Thermodesulfobacteriota bacterium]|nr:response regulator [Thermodesulfobacteriota bacterium]